MFYKADITFHPEINRRDRNYVSVVGDHSELSSPVLNIKALGSMDPSRGCTLEELFAKQEETITSGLAAFRKDFSFYE